MRQVLYSVAMAPASPTLDMVAAVLLGNLVYFALLPWLPAWAQHRRFTLDWGIAVDFLFCLAVYNLLRTVRRLRSKRRR